MVPWCAPARTRAAHVPPAMSATATGERESYSSWRQRTAPGLHNLPRLEMTTGSASLVSAARHDVAELLRVLCVLERTWVAPRHVQAVRPSARLCVCEREGVAQLVAHSARNMLRATLRRVGEPFGAPRPDVAGAPRPIAAREALDRALTLRVLREHRVYKYLVACLIPQWFYGRVKQGPLAYSTASQLIR